MNWLRNTKKVDENGNSFDFYLQEDEGPTSKSNVQNWDHKYFANIFSNADFELLPRLQKLCECISPKLPARFFILNHSYEFHLYKMTLMKVLFSDILLGNYCCKQHYKLHISLCEVEKCVTFPTRIRKVLCSMHICIILHTKTDWREHVAAFTSMCDSLCVSICLCPESARLIMGA